ncbi:MAG: site-specific integrase [Victivallales bacterium]
MKTTSGHLQQRKKDANGNWCGNWYLQYDVNGKRKLVSLHTSNLAEAKRRADEILTPALMAKTSEKVTRHIAETRDLLSNIKYPLEIVWKQYLKNPKRPQKSSIGTLGNYERNWNMFCKWLNANHAGITKINEITEKEAIEYAEHLWIKKDDKPKKTGKTKDNLCTAKPCTDHKPLTAEQKKAIRGITAVTFNYHLQALKLIFKVILNSDKTPFSEIERKPEDRINRNDFSEEQLKRIFASFDDPNLIVQDKKGMKLLCYIGFYTGLRLIDAVHLTWKQIDFTNNMIHAMPIKTKGIQRPVHIPLRNELKIQLYLAESKNDTGGYVMPSMVLRYERNPDGIIDDFHKILDLESVGLKDIHTAKRGKNRRLLSFHSFRHTFASIAANNGADMASLKIILGDDERTLMKYYVKASDQNKLKAVMSLPSL